MTTAIQVIEKVRNTAKAKASDRPRSVGALGNLDFVRQGDVYLFNLPGVPINAKKVARPVPQIAPGTTQGSRHVIADISTVTLYEMPNANALQGPIVDAPNGFTLEHPEHGHQTLPAGIYAITFQRAFADTLRRVAD